MTGGTDTGQGDLFSMIDLGDWDNLPTNSDEEIPGIENITHGLKAFYDDRDMPQLVPTSPGQPTITGTWEGNWGGRFGADFNDKDFGDANTMSINVTIQGNSVEATLTYDDVDVLGGGSFTTSAATVNTSGRFTPSGTATAGGSSLTYSGAGQFGGTDQRGVAGYLEGPAFASLFWGDRGN